jgi:peptide/nickel transport system ATP-binding protein
MQDFRAFANAGGGVLLITHDIALALSVADRIAVFNDGTIVEETAVENFAAPERLREPYTRKLWHALPEHHAFKSRAGRAVCMQPDVQSDAGALSDASKQAGEHTLQAQNVTFSYTSNKNNAEGIAAASHQNMLNNISLMVASSERLAISGPSGRGKSTLCKLLAGYYKPKSGKILLDGEPLMHKGACPVQLISQHPEQALDTHIKVGESLREALLGSTRSKQTAGGTFRKKTLFGSYSRAKNLSETEQNDDSAFNMLNEKMCGICEQLGIKPEWLGRYPLELSGGQLQRICIARALVCEPRFIIADEISTMLDAITQEQIWSFLLDWCDAHSTGIIFVSHSPALTNHIATRTFEL